MWPKRILDHSGNTQPPQPGIPSVVGEVTVSIVFYAGEQDLRRCLKCLSLQSLPPSRVIIVDNSEAGLSADAVEFAWPVEILRNGRNLGFAAGNNLALHQAETEFFATLNADAFPEPDWLLAMLQAAREHPEVAAFGSLQLLDENTALADGIGDHYHISGLAWRGGYLCPVAELDLSPRQIFSPCGAAAFFRKADLQEIGGFDEDFFCYCEDLDAGFRLWLSGRECRFVPEAVVRHKGAGSTGDAHSDFAVYHGHRNLTWVYLKNMPSPLFLLFLPLHILLCLQMVHAVTFRGQGEMIRKAKMDALTGLAKLWGKRMSIQSRQRASLLAVWRVLDKSIPPEPWKRSLARVLQNRFKKTNPTTPC